MRVLQLAERLLVGAVLALLAAGESRVHAQDGDREVFLPDSIVVTASRYAEPARYTGRRVAVWTAAELQSLPVAHVDEFLRTFGGVDVNTRGGFGVQSDLTIRGSTFNGVLLLLDGVAINDPMTGHFLMDLPVPLSEVARIEVLRGPAAAVYGPDALGGVVQIFTVDGLHDGRSPRTVPGMEVRMQAGSHALFTFNGALRGIGERTRASLAGAWQGTDGEPVLDANGSVVRSGDEPVRTDFQRRVLTSALGHDLGGSSLLARLGWDSRDFGAFQFYTPFPSDTARESTETLWAQIRLAGAHGATDWRAQVAAKEHHDRYVYNPVTPANTHVSRFVEGQVDATRVLTEELSVSAGASSRLRGIDSNNLGRHQDVSAGLFSTMRARRGRWSVHGGGRVDYDPSYGVEVTPQLFATYAPGAMTFRAGAARAVRAPTYVERYFNTTLARPRGGNLGNPDLHPERSFSYEAGVSAEPVAGLSVHVTGFRRITRDLIDWAMLAPEDTVFLARNLHRVRTNGIEAELESRRPLRDGHLTATVAYTYLDADVGQVPDAVQYKYALTSARHLLQAMLLFRVARFSGSVQALHKDPIQGAGYEVVHTRLAYEPGSSGLSLSVELRNAFDVRYSDVFNAPMPGRWWIFGIRLRR